MNQTIFVSGMTCDHCINAVTKELSKLSEVKKVEVDLTSGKIDIDTNTEIERARLEEAITEAGYELK
ncbi:MAG: heavy-metal-associated domain-containing protein [Actinomycetes bacterium]|jgi:copper ion binding protein